MRSLGHDFAVMELLTQSARAHQLPVSQWADVRSGIGFRYLLLIEQPLRPNTDFSLRVLDAEGNNAGNVSGAVACAAQYVLDSGLTGKSRVKFFIAGTAVNTEIQGQRVTINKGRPRLEPSQLSFKTDRYKAEYDLAVEGMGQIQLGVLALANTHTVARTDAIDEYPLETWAKHLQQHPQLPENSRFGLVQMVTEQHLRLACQYAEYWDESACAAVVSAQLRGWLASNATVAYDEEEVQIEWSGQPQHAVFLTCRAHKLYYGRIIF